MSDYSIFEPPAAGVNPTLEGSVPEEETRGKTSHSWTIFGALSAVAVLLLSAAAGYFVEKTVSDDALRTRYHIKPVSIENAAKTNDSTKMVGVQNVVSATLPTTVLIYVILPHGIAKGSGSIISPDGYVVTCHHVIDGHYSNKVHIFLSDYHHYQGTIVGYDKATDLAVLKFNPGKHLDTVKYGSSDQTPIGSQVVAIGSPQNSTFISTAGILSSRDRPTIVPMASSRDYYAFPGLQTDAAVNEGNSGGPLFNSKGEQIGINESGIVTKTGGNVSVGVNMSIPIDLARKVITEISKKGSFTHGGIGIFFNPPSHEDEDDEDPIAPYKGASVTPKPNGALAKAGVTGKITITTFNKKRVFNALHLLGFTNFLSPGDTVNIGYLDNGKQKTVKVTATPGRDSLVLD